MVPKFAPQTCVAFSRRLSNTGCSSPADELMTRRTSDVAVCCCSASESSLCALASSRSRRSSCFFRSGAGERRPPATLAALRPFAFPLDFGFLERRVVIAARPGRIPAQRACMVRRVASLSARHSTPGLRTWNPNVAHQRRYVGDQSYGRGSEDAVLCLSRNGRAWRSLICLRSVLGYPRLRRKAGIKPFSRRQIRASNRSSC